MGCAKCGAPLHLENGVLVDNYSVAQCPEGGMHVKYDPNKD